MAENEGRVPLATVVSRATTSQFLMASSQTQKIKNVENPSPLRKTARFDQINKKASLSHQNQHRNPLGTISNNNDSNATVIPTKFSQDEKCQQENVKNNNKQRIVEGWTIYADPKHNDSILDDSTCNSQTTKSVTSDKDENESHNNIKSSQSTTTMVQKQNQLIDDNKVVGNDDLYRLPTNVWQPRMSASEAMFKEDSLDSFRDTSGMSGSPMVMDDSSSVYGSAASGVTSDYHTAPLATLKEAHREIVYAAPEYADDIVQYLLKREDDSRIRISRSYMSKQSELSGSMRRILVDWLVDVAEEYNLDQHTLHLAARYVDRFLSVMDVPRGKLQLVGTTSIMIAAKLEEIYPPELREFVYITDDTYSESQYLCDLGLLSLELAPTKSSLIAASAVCLANLMTDVPIPWPVELERLTGYKTNVLFHMIQQLITLLHSAHNPPNAVYKKYSDDKYLNAASIPVPDAESLTLGGFAGW